MARMLPNLVSLVSRRSFASRPRDRRDMLRDMPKRDEGVAGERGLVNIFGEKNCEFPDVETPNRVFDGMRFSQVPIVNVHVSKNNTIITAADYKGNKLLVRSCGMEGFKNCRKGTNVAAQATGVSMSQKLLMQGLKTVRVCVSGLGPGRMSSVQGLVMGGLNIISITDTTPFADKPPRPPAAKSL